MSRGVLALELDAPYQLGPIEITELTVALPDVKFPVDLSGGVSKFRHRRGVLDRLVVTARALDIASWGAPRLKGLLAAAAPELVVAPFEGGALVGVRAGASALAFDVLVAPLDGDLRLLVERARGLGLGAPPHTLALRALSALIGSAGKLVEGAVVVRLAGSLIGREVLPAAGARAPTSDGLRFSTLETELTRFSIEATSETPLPELERRTLSALETCELAGAADPLALTGDFERARDRLLSALERAPRHAEITARLAWLDYSAGGRTEGALATLGEAVPASFAGVLGGELLALVGDVDGARAAFARAAEDEPYGPLSALAWVRVARLASEIDDRHEALDHAVARAPGLDVARWERLAARLDTADVRGARADAEHLEASAQGSDARRSVWVRAADMFLACGLVAEAASLFERALRYAPDDAASVAGLARSLRAAGQGQRAVDLLARAAALEARIGKRTPGVDLELARALADLTGDKPAAIARVHGIAGDAQERFEARFWEGRWRSELGDIAGAAVAFGRLRDAVELTLTSLGDRSRSVAALLAEAAAIEENQGGDVLAAQRDLGLALRVAPRDRVIGGAFRRVSALVAARGPAALDEPEPPAGATEPPGPAFDEPLDADVLEARVEQLTHRIRADTRDAEAAIELALALETLGRDLEVLALASARLEEGDAAERTRMMRIRTSALQRLSRAARAAGRDAEAELYDDMLKMQE